MNLRRGALRAAAAFLALAAALLAAACIAYPPAYVWRVLVWQDADADDWQRFAMRRITPAANAQPLPRALQPAAVAAAWRTAGGSAAMEQELEALGTQAFLVLRDGVVVHESYANGGSREGWVTSFSVAKSFLSTLMGIAVAEGRIPSLDEPVTRWLPELLQRDARFARVTLRHLLHMASGLRYEEFPFLHGDDAKTYYHPDLRALALHDSEVQAPPGSRFHYNNYHPLLLGLVLERATGMPVATYLEHKLWRPAGMVGEASWSLDRQDGFEKMESGLNARAEDFARFGLLMLRGGGGVVPAGWAAESTSPPVVPAGYYAGSPWMAHEPRRFYAAMWWGEARPEGGRDFAARGNKGQLVFVSPRNGVVIVRHGWRYGIPAAEWFARARRMADALGGAAAR